LGCESRLPLQWHVIEEAAPTLLRNGHDLDAAPGRYLVLREPQPKVFELLNVVDLGAVREPDVRGELPPPAK
jgi:hypothetical protein